ncbi:MAG TPA: hypothetical protein PKE62_03875 [Anaerolineales bacterium]|nr:hypothetical protein [Anaerolineales bacterium]
MERWEYIEVRFLADIYRIYFYPEDKIDTTKIKQAFKNRGELEIEQQRNSAYLYFGHYGRVEGSDFVLALNILGQGGWEAFAASDSEGRQSVFLKRRIEK